MTVSVEVVLLSSRRYWRAVQSVEQSDAALLADTSVDSASAAPTRDAVSGSSGTVDRLTHAIVDRAVGGALGRSSCYQHQWRQRHVCRCQWRRQCCPLDSCQEQCIRWRSRTQHSLPMPVSTLCQLQPCATVSVEVVPMSSRRQWTNMQPAELLDAALPAIVSVDSALAAATCDCVDQECCCSQRSTTSMFTNGGGAVAGGGHLSIGSRI